MKLQRLVIEEGELDEITYDFCSTQTALPLNPTYHLIHSCCNLINWSERAVILNLQN